MIELEGWISNLLGEVLFTKNDKAKQVKSSEYLEVGSYPVVDQSADFICGYHDDFTKLIHNDLPLIVFGDHTRHTKYIDFPFIAGADGTQLIKPRWEIHDKFFYYLVTNAAQKIGNFGYDRHFKHLKEYVCSYPDKKPEQGKIAEILSTVDMAIEQTETLIAKQQSIKTGIMQDLLTRGIDEQGNIRSEQTHQFKDSPLGRIPVEWEVENLSTIVDLQVGYAFKSEWFSENGIRLLRGENVGNGTPNWKDQKCLPDSMASKFQDYMLFEGDMIIGMDRTFTKQGIKVSLLRKEDVPSLLVQRVGRFRPLSIPNGFMEMLIQSPVYQRELFLQQKGMDIPHLSKSEILSPLVPIPKTSHEMTVISSKGEMFQRIEQEYVVHLLKLHSLKTALMQDLLTGKKRVTPLLNESEVVS